MENATPNSPSTSLWISERLMAQYKSIAKRGMPVAIIFFVALILIIGLYVTSLSNSFLDPLLNTYKSNEKILRSSIFFILNLLYFYFAIKALVVVFNIFEHIKSIDPNNDKLVQATRLLGRFMRLLTIIAGISLSSSIVSGIFKIFLGNG